VDQLTRLEGAALPLDRIDPTRHKTQVPLLGPPAPIVLVRKSGVYPIHNVSFAWINERTGDDHYQPVLQLATWGDANGKVTNLTIHDLPPARFYTPHPLCTPESFGIHAAVVFPKLTL
jgi:hypothetical protein